MMEVRKRIWFRFMPKNLTWTTGEIVEGVKAGVLILLFFRVPKGVFLLPWLRRERLIVHL